MYSTVIPNYLERFYTVRYYCNNCGYSFAQRIRYGYSAPRTATCENCGVQAYKVNTVGPTVPTRPVSPPWKREKIIYAIYK